MKLWKILSAVILFFTSLLGFAVEVVNAGHSGWNSRQLREIFAGELQNHRPDLVVLMVGTNDNLNSYNLVPLSEYRDNLTAMVVAAKAFGANVLLCEIPRVNEEMMSRRHKEGFFRRESAEKKVNNVNAIVAEVAKNQNVPLLATTKVLGASTSDAASLFRNTANSGTADGVHPTANGYFLRFPASEIPVKKKGALGVRGIQLQKKDELEHVYLFEEGTETKISYNDKEVTLNRLKQAKRDGAGTKYRG